MYRDSLKPIAELDASGNVLAVYGYAEKYTTPSFVEKNGQRYRVISDHLGSPRVVVNAADSSDRPVVGEYAAFGEVSGGGQGWLPFGFAGGIYDADTGLVRFGARDYDPVAGRWTGKDPIGFNGDETGLYVYARNGPHNAIDPSGLSKYDKLFGLPKRLWNWCHRRRKGKLDRDLTKDEAEKLCKEWEQLGKPGPDKKRARGRGSRDENEVFDIEDFLDLLFPFPPIPQCLLDGSCGENQSEGA